MAIFGKGDANNLTLELAKAQVKNELYEERIGKLEAQIERLQEALVAATAPRAYEQILIDKAEPEVPSPEKLRKEEENLLFMKHMQNIEAPTFRDADDMIAALSGMIGVNAGSDSIHSNNES